MKSLESLIFDALDTATSRAKKYTSEGDIQAVSATLAEIAKRRVNRDRILASDSIEYYVSDYQIPNGLLISEIVNVGSISLFNNCIDDKVDVVSKARCGNVDSSILLSPDKLLKLLNDYASYDGGINWSYSSVNKCKYTLTDLAFIMPFKTEAELNILETDNISRIFIGGQGLSKPACELLGLMFVEGVSIPHNTAKHVDGIVIGDDLILSMFGFTRVSSLERPNFNKKSKKNNSKDNDLEAEGSDNNNGNEAESGETTKSE